jgi:hypothetical protein
VGPRAVLDAVVKRKIAHKISIVLNCHYSVNSTSLYTHRPQKSSHRTLFFGEFYQWSKYVKRVTVLSVSKANGKQLRANKSRIMLFISFTFLSSANTSFGVYQKLYFPS